MLNFPLTRSLLHSRFRMSPDVLFAILGADDILNNLVLPQTEETLVLSVSRACGRSSQLNSDQLILFLSEVLFEL